MTTIQLEKMVRIIVQQDGESRRRAIIALLSGASIELSTRDRAAEDACRDLLAPGTAIYINHAPGDSYHRTVATAGRLRAAGFEPVPHVAGRYLTGFTQLNDFVARAAGEAAVDRILLIAGDIDRPAGPFESSRQMLETGVFARHGIRRVGIAGYPEGHPKIATQDLDAALRAKLELLRGAGIEAYIVTQFSFEAAPILAWVERLRAAGIDVPVHVGLAGPASVASLAKFAVRCGIGNSILALARGQSAVARLLVESGPEPIIAALADADVASLGVEGLHFFAFGGTLRTGKWLQAIARGKFALAADGAGFRVDSRA